MTIGLIALCLLGAVFILGFLLNEKTAGALYSLIRWRLRQDRVAAKIKAEREKGGGANVEYMLTKMRVGYNKAVLTSWIAFWPLDILILLFEEPIQRIYEWLTTRYQAISRGALEKHGLDDLKDRID